VDPRMVAMNGKPSSGLKTCRAGYRKLEISPNNIRITILIPHENKMYSKKPIFSNLMILRIMNPGRKER
jgi:hypothetical protein